MDAKKSKTLSLCSRCSQPSRGGDVGVVTVIHNMESAAIGMCIGLYGITRDAPVVMR